ncbi:MAG: GAF domain-containing protein, partial [Phycisphaerae bacterium]|nr:GAF domain-containing protein [Phycisphaerae bacterium]
MGASPRSVNSSDFSDSNRTIQKPDPAQTESGTYVDVLRPLLAELHCSHVAIASLLPRGALQITQSVSNAGANDFVRLYNRTLNRTDRTTWQVLERQSPVAVTKLPDGFAPFTINSMAVAPLEGPVFDGYPGVLQAYRQSAPFSSAELKRLTEAADRINRSVASHRAATNEQTSQTFGAPPIPGGALVLDNGGKVIFGQRFAAELDSTLRSQLEKVAARPGRSSWTRDLIVADARGIRRRLRAASLGL